MTTRRPQVPTAPGTTSDDLLLVVAVCDGHRCRALRALQDGRTPHAPASGSLIREAVRRTRRSIMLSTSCLGPCAHGAVVAVGRAVLQGGDALWIAPPVHWGATETAEHATQLATWITTAQSPGGEVRPEVPAGP